MDNKILNTISKDLSIIKEILEFLLHINSIEKEDFQFCVKKLNELENDTFFLKNIYDIDTISLLKKIFSIIDRNKKTYYEYKNNIFKCFKAFENLYIAYLKTGVNEKKNNIVNIENEIHSITKNIQDILNKKNESKNYYYIKLTLDSTVPYFYLSRRTILRYLLQFGNPYNYTPDILDDDLYTYFIMDYKVDKNVDVENIFKYLKENDAAIKKYEIYKIHIDHNIYNLKFYINEEVNENSCLFMPNFNFLDIVHYRNYYDTYIESKNQRYLLEPLLKMKDKNINLVTIKKISDREVRIFLPAGLNSKNITNIKKIIGSILIDKNISEILYSLDIDFLGLQMLEYLRRKYNIEFGNVLQWVRR